MDYYPAGVDPNEMNRAMRSGARWMAGRVWAGVKAAAKAKALRDEESAYIRF